MKVFNHTGHFAMWDWLLEHPKADKNDWPGWRRNGGEYKHTCADCFACDIVPFDGPDCHEGGKCPLDWPEGCGCQFGIRRMPQSYFWRWTYSDNLAERTELAQLIRDVPIQKGIEVI